MNAMETIKSSAYEIALNGFFFWDAEQCEKTIAADLESIERGNAFKSAIWMAVAAAACDYEWEHEDAPEITPDVQRGMTFEIAKRIVDESHSGMHCKGFVA